MQIANSHQVGGSHYKTKYEHWDLVLDTHMGYLEGQATKYVTRWRKKNGMEDLQKALHYVNKLIENWKREAQGKDYTSLAPAVLRFAEINELTGMEGAFVMQMVTWEDGGNLHEAQQLLLEIMKEHDRLTVPVSDSNKHADRA